MTWFQFSRLEGYPSRFTERKISARYDVTEILILVIFGCIAFSFVLITFTIKGIKRRVVISRIYTSLIVGALILLGNYGYSWEYGKLHIKSQYKPGSPEEIEGTIELKLSLRGFNITLSGGNNLSEKDGPSEINDPLLYYNEHFSWTWGQGRLGFGPYANQASQDFRRASLRGIPIPILQAAEYFTIDGEGVRFGRHYRLSGWYCHILMWSAFCTWLVTNILFLISVRPASQFLALTGALQLTSVLIWCQNRPPAELRIPFEPAEDSVEEVLVTHYGVLFYLVSLNSILCLILSATIYFFDLILPDEIGKFFGIDPLSLYEESLMSKDELNKEVLKIKKQRAYLRKDSLSDHSLEKIEKANASLNPSFESERSVEKETYSSSAATIMEQPVYRRKSYKLIPPQVTPRRNRFSRTPGEMLSNDEGTSLLHSTPASTSMSPKISQEETNLMSTTSPFLVSDQSSLQVSTEERDYFNIMPKRKLSPSPRDEPPPRPPKKKS